MEHWVDLVRFPNYEISTHGRVRNRRTGHILTPFPDRYGYLRVSIGSTDNVYIHRLMCETFYGSPDETQTQVNHIDCDRQNNHILNLHWCTPSENIRWAVAHGNCNPRRASAAAAKVNVRAVRLIETGDVFSSVKECARFLGVEPTNVSRCLTGQRKGQRLKGYHIEYVEEDIDI
jgi:hypothetical protein